MATERVTGYLHHPLFERPEPHAGVWRYFDLAKFLDLLERRTLFFSRADRLGDPWEGAINQRSLEAGYASLREQAPNLKWSREQFLEDQLALRTHVAKFIHISCWYLSEVESAAMWDIYAGREGRGIAVQTTFERLEQALPVEHSTPIYAGKVHYLDYTRDLMPQGNLFYPFLHKRSSFEHEHELRIVIDASEGDDLHPMNHDYDPPDFGQYVPVDLHQLAERVHVAPTAPDWMLELVESLVRRYGLNAPVTKSSLYDGPVL